MGKKIEQAKSGKCPKEAIHDVSCHQRPVLCKVPNRLKTIHINRQQEEDEDSESHFRQIDKQWFNTGIEQRD